MVKSVRVIVPSQSICDQLAQQHTEIEDRLVVLPSPIDLTRYTPERLKPAPIRQKYELDGKFTFVSLSRITKEKNLPLLVEAFSQVVKIYQNTRLLIVGDGPVRKDLEKQAEQLGIETPLLFAGYVDPTAVPHHLAAADAFAFASTAETQGIVMAEAMAAGLPVVAVNAPGSRDVVCHEVSGLLTKNTADDLAQAMMRLVQDQALCRSLSTSALQTATSYSPSLLANQLVEIYQGAIAIYAQEPLSYKRPSRDSDNTRQFPPHWFNELTGEGVDSLSSFWQRLSSYWRMDLDD
jgi:glycosyltransferase involved in cell wall biosynthesis